VFNIIARKTILEYARRYPKASNALFAWYYEIVNADYKNFNQLKADHPSASIVGDDRVVSNIMGNNYRLVVRIVFAYRAVQIKWFGTHKEYNEINVQTIDPRRN
jgi:mRNA interferase HigB